MQDLYICILFLAIFFYFEAFCDICSKKERKKETDHMLGSKNVHLDSRRNWLDFGGQRSKVCHTNVWQNKMTMLWHLISKRSEVIGNVCNSSLFTFLCGLELVLRHISHQHSNTVTYRWTMSKGKVLKPCLLSHLSAQGQTQCEVGMFVRLSVLENC